MENNLQPSDSKEEKRLMPLLHADQYYFSEIKPDTITREEKISFLENYYKTGNITKAAKLVGRDRAAFMQHVEKDKAFAVDFYNVKVAIKEDLEEVMTLNGLKEKGYMDRITWLRKNFPAEYNPNYDRSQEDKQASAIKELAQKLNDYEIIPKKKVIDVEEEK